jgi:LuxR family maltose regulon positive regulatory protein
MPKADPLLRTKLRQPFTRAGLVARPRLQDQLAQGLRGPLTLITAPAGFGKTTLVAAAVAAGGMPVAWLSLDKQDNQSDRFLTYLVAALQTVDPTLGNEAAQLLAESPPAPSNIILTCLLNDLDAASEERVLVLDDYQLISSPAVYEEVAFLLEHCPPSFHLLIATRSDPPLPLARLRARGQLVELRTADLRFTSSEAAQFLNEVMGLRLDAGAVALLAEQTEGWIAGLQMAALSMRDRKDVFAFIEGFSGTNRYILDYLLEEVLASQSPDIQRFLLCTSILERLTAPLCAAVLVSEEGSRPEGEDRATRPEAPVLRPSAAILEYLERANLFLIPLDEERQWYRYHHLFQDLLLHRLKSADRPEEIAEYHRRAAAWLEANDFISESIQHSLDAGDYEKAADLVERYTLRLFNQGKLHQLLSWTDILPETIVVQRPRLSIYRAWILGFAGKPVEAQQMASIARQAIQSRPLPLEEVRALEIELGGIQAFLAISLGDAPSALALSGLVKEQDAGQHLFACSVIHWSLGFAHRMQGDLGKAIPEFESVLQIGEQLGNSWTILSGSHDLGMVLRLSGRLHEAEAVLRRGLQLIDQLGSGESGFVGRQESALSIALYDRNELEEAHRLALNGIEHNRLWDNPNHTVNGFRALARVLIARGELDSADQALRKAETILAQAPIVPPVRANVEALRVRWWLACGNTEKANEWLANHPIVMQSDQKPSEVSEIHAIAAARVWVALGNRAAAWELLCTLEPAAREMRRITSLIEILILKALSAPDPSAEMENLEEALACAHPEGYQRVFLDAGQPMQLLLARWLAHAGDNPLRNYARDYARDYALHLLAHFAADLPIDPAAQAKGAPPGDRVKPELHPAQAMLVESEIQPAKNTLVESQALIEPLSQRELEVLQLMALGRTNQAIARQLIVAQGTIKAHAASIYRKLDVANRTEAVARARQLGLLP